MINKSGRWLALLIAPLLLLGCFGGNKDNKSSDGAADSKVLAVVETMFGQVTVNKPKGGELRVVALGWGDAEAALAMGVKPVAVFDWLSFGEANKGVGPWAKNSFGDVNPTVMPRSQDGFNYEQIQALNPDVILNVRSANDEKNYERLKQIAPTIYPTAGTKAWTIDWQEQQKQIAAALGMPKKAEEVIAKTEAAAKKGQNPAYKGVNSAVFVKYGGGAGVYLPGDNRQNLLDSLGFSFEPRLKELPAQGFYAQLPADKISLIDTDVMVMMSTSKDTTVEQMKSDPLVAALNVAKDGRVIYLDRDTAQLISAGTPLSIPVAVETLKPLLDEAVSKLKR